MQLFSSIADKISQHGGLSLPEVSGLIATGVFVVHFFIPFALPLIVLALLKERNGVTTASAMTWSVVGSFLNSSIWPNILSADSAASTAVPTGILLLTKIKKLLVALVAVAGIVTPLGLYEKILASDSSTPSAFHYISDPSPFGYGTPPRDNLRWSRRCGYYLPTQCPNSFSNITNHGNKTGMYASVEREDTHVPQYVIDAFQSGLSMFNDSVSSIFDIQPRHYTWSKVPKTPDSNSPDNGNPYPISHFRQISSLSLERKVTLVEGLVVDAENGGVGFRNHSAPPVKDFGSEWSEDILFIEPETQCADTNLTLDFMLPKYNSTTSEIANLVLTDRGGFVNHAHKGPKPTVTDPQNDPDLYARAHTAAWYNNAMTMVYMNVSNMRNLSDPNSKAYEYINSKVGKRFPLIDPKSSNFALSAPAGISPYALQSTTEFGKYLPDLGSAIFSNFSKRSNTTGKLYPNPFHVSKDDFTSIQQFCSGTSPSDIGNISTFAAQCGMLYGAPRPQNGDSSIVFVPGSNWSIPLYSCVTATKAIVKTVKFQFNGSDDLSGLTVTGLTEKKYSNQSSKPLWGVEVTNQELVNTSPLWGLVSSPDQGNISLSTLRKESLYLPGNLGSYSQMAAVADNVPGTSFHTQALLEAYQIGDSQQKADYSGKSNMALFRLWQNYSSDPANAARILNVVWTDWAANTVVGSRGIHTNGSATLHKRSSTSQDLYPVINYHRRIRYHLPYAIPAIVALFFAALILVGTVVACFGDSGPRKMKRFLMKTSPARILTARLYGSSSPQPPTYTSSGITSILSRGKQWQDTTGRKDISLSQQQPDNVVIHDSKFAERTEPLLYDGMHLTPM